MQSKTSLFNKGILLQNIRSVGWVGLVYLLSLLFALPLQLIMIYTNDVNRHQNYHHLFTETESLFAVSGGFQIFLMFTIPVLLAVFLFRYMQVKLSADYIHSLPISREKLYFHNIISGVFLLVIPVVITSLVLFILVGALDIEPLTVGVIVNWIGITILSLLFVFFAGLFVAMFTGMSVLHAGLVYILFLFPAGISFLLFINMKFYLFGFSYDYYFNQFDQIVPFVRLSQLVHQPLTVMEIISYTILIIIFIFIGFISYKKRNVEAATQAITFKVLRPVFKFGVTACAMLLGGAYFGETQGGIGWIIFGYVTASLIGYIIAQMILEKTWRVFGKWKGYLVYSVCIVIVGVLLQLDVTGYESRIPELGNVERIYFAESIHYIDEERQDRWGYEREQYVQRLYYYHEAQSLEDIRQFHQEIVNERQVLSSNYSNDTRPVVIGYELENGRKVVRQYQIEIERFKDFYRPIVESDEYKRNQFPLLQVDDFSEIKSVSFHNYRIGGHVEITEKENIQELLTLLQNEMVNESYEDTILNQDGWSDIEVIWNNNKRLNATWKKSYLEIENWLIENGLMEKARVTSNDLTHISVIKNNDNMDVYEFYRNDELLGQFESEGRVLTVEDEEKIEESLRKSTWRQSGEYIVIQHYVNQPSHIDILSFPVNDVPQFIIDHFE
ncbi:DUF6449 domain-containing protein [Bacillus sp. FJAT-45350]|uniref:DUF6449 domain-containing protein n=1 Tax=Bacillus sp. FJAT-45350 TaxID=2011014 RepID=UPI000BB79BFA|nr:DUF6449 domain-containing protein [Bacillus sp. FJAT-45350]